MKRRRDTIVIGGSAGSVAVLRGLLARLPADLGASVSAVVHVSQNAPTQLDKLIARATELAVVIPADGAPLREGHVVLGPPGYHLAIEEDAIKLWRGPRENHVRPAIDVLFRSAAVSRGPRVIGVLLSGTLHDGSAGFEAIRKRGGTTVVQDPHDAEFPGMPQSAIDAGQADEVVPAEELADRLLALVGEEVHETAPPDAELDREVAIARGSRDETAWEQMGPTAFVCPDCGGPLRRVEPVESRRFRCRHGHAFGADSLAAEQAERTEHALWNAVRVMEDRAILFEEMASAARGHAQAAGADSIAASAREARAHVEALHALLASFERSAAE